MGDFVGTNPSVFRLTPSESERLRRQLAEQLVDVQQRRTESGEQLIDRLDADRRARERAQAGSDLRRVDDREDVNRAIDEQQRQRVDLTVEENRRTDTAQALARDLASQQLADQQRLAEQLRQVDARLQEQREIERQRAARQIVDLRQSEQRIIEADFNRLAPRGSIVDIVA